MADASTMGYCNRSSCYSPWPPGRIYFLRVYASQREGVFLNLSFVPPRALPQTARTSLCMPESAADLTL